MRTRVARTGSLRTASGDIRRTIAELDRGLLTATASMLTNDVSAALTIRKTRTAAVTPVSRGARARYPAEDALLLRARPYELSSKRCFARAAPRDGRAFLRSGHPAHRLRLRLPWAACAGIRAARTGAPQRVAPSGAAGVAAGCAGSRCAELSVGGTSFSNS